MEDDISLESEKSKLNNGINNVSIPVSQPIQNGIRKKRGRRKIQRGPNGEIASSDNASHYAGLEDSGEEDLKRKQDKIEQRREMLRKHNEEVKWQAVHKILNEKGRKEREKEKNAKKEVEDLAAKNAALEAKKKASLSNIRIKYYRDGSIKLSFPQGFLLPHVLNQEKMNGFASNNDGVKMEKKLINAQKCEKCGGQGKYCNPKSKKISCSLSCYKLIN